MDKEEIEQWIKDHPKEAEMVVKGMTEALKPLIPLFEPLLPIIIDALRPLFEEMDKTLQVILENEDMTLEEFINLIKELKKQEGD